MRVVAILQAQVEKKNPLAHRGSVRALFGAVEALVVGGKLWLTGLGRSRFGKASPKHSIKAIDRMLGSNAQYRNRALMYSGLCSLLLRGNRFPVVLVDATEIQKQTALVASLAFDGRSLAIYSIVGSKKNISQRRTRKRFLNELRDILPVGTYPIIVTDAGFESPWFDDVEAMGWHYVGRVRKRTKFLLHDQWMTAPQLHARATNRASNLGMLEFPKCKPKKRRLLLSKHPKLKGRKRRTRAGKPGKRTADRRCSKSHREPWLLTTSLRCRPNQVVKLYSLRTQIEEMFRDAKNHRWGWALDKVRSRSTKRVEILLLIAALASVVLQSIGYAGEQIGLHHRYQANTVRSRRVLSLPVLAIQLIKSADVRLLAPPALRAALLSIQQQIRSLSPLST